VRSLLLAASFPPALGGVETLLYETNRRLAEPPLVLAPAPASAPDLHVIRVPMGLSSRVAYRPLWRLHPSLHYAQRFLQQALRATRRWQPQVVQAGHVYLAPLANLLSRRFKVPYVVYAYGQEVWRGGPTMGVSGLDARLRGGALRSADRALVPGSFTEGLLLADWHIRKERVVRVPYGADPQPVSSPPTGSSLLSVGRLVPRKGIDTTIRALRCLPSDVAYRVVGSGPDAQRLRDLAREQGVAERVTFVGRVDAAQLAAEYQRCAIFVQPARRTGGELEGYGLVYFEAAAWGRAVIAGRSGGEVDAVVDGVTGCLVDGTSVQAVASTIEALLRDPEQLQAMGAAGRRRVETTHNWTQAARVVDATLAEACR
jgi:glycosyltransferase involved in cell wall biosynthesis